MSAAALQLTLAQQRKVLPKKLKATGKFDVRVDSKPEIYQTKTLQHNAEYAVYKLEGRHANNATTIKKIFIQAPNTTRPDTYDLSKQGEEGIQAWYSVTAPSGDFTVKCIVGSLTVLTISGGPLAMSGSMNVTTEKNSFGVDYFLQVDFTLVS